MGKDKEDTEQERTQEPFNDKGPSLQKDKTVNETGNDSTWVDPLTNKSQSNRASVASSFCLLTHV